MVDERQHSEQPERIHGHFSEGLDHREDFPEDEREGRFSVGPERLQHDPEKQRQGRFGRGEKALPEEDPEKHVERRFSEGVEASPPMGVPRLREVPAAEAGPPIAGQLAGPRQGWLAACQDSDCGRGSRPRSRLESRNRPGRQVARRATPRAWDGLGLLERTALERVPREVKRFIAGNIDSVGRLELLLLVRSDPERYWSASEVGAELRSGRAWAELQLEYLRVQGLLVAGESSKQAYRYEPARPEAEAVVARLSEAFDSQRAEVIRLIFSQRPSERRRASSEAFGLRKEQ